MSRLFNDKSYKYNDLEQHQGLGVSRAYFFVKLRKDQGKVRALNKAMDKVQPQDSRKLIAMKTKGRH